ncbi:flagellar motor protein MotA [Thioalkalivibrio denitrificans]|uniref:Flagellar motor protein MotA n=1 Tax=Thioalkalivibrio denitrificans TaxID=108003 RepID=A0A1V3NL97_9GAMM|nr:flagellar motor protein MotA [Thioalkalivibrio denitrificans]OOG25897.1 flagellar motor protein MotA [Thioalkalivibrio denitrificans]
MRNTRNALVWMTLFLLAVAVVVVLLYGPLTRAFMANPVFNGMILAVLFAGLVINYRQVLILGPEVRWIERFRSADAPDAAAMPRTRLLGAMARLLTGRHGEQFTLSTMSLRTLLDGIRSRLDESRDISRYIIGLLVFLGLLGTFWGLLETLGGVSAVISGLHLGGEDVTAAFRGLQAGLETPLSGLGTAFSSSLFGLAGALVLGFIDLQSGHAQNRFYNELEEWLAGQTRLSSGGLGTEGEGSVPAYIQALLEQTSDSLDKLQRVMARGEDNRRAAEQRLESLIEEVGALAEQSRGDHKAMMNMVRTQGELQGVLQNLAESTDSSSATDAQIRDQLQQLTHTLDTMRQELGVDRTELNEVLREEIRLLARTLARTGDPGRG